MNDAGIQDLSSTTPVLLLPALWVLTRHHLGAWIGASLSVIGTALLI